jgi:hypothetical protein
MAELFGSDDLILRLNGMVEDLEAKADEAAAKAEQAISGLRGGVLAALEARGLPCPAHLRARLMSCDEPATLQRWLLRALSASTAAEAFAE